jgi:hypothetical protein
MVSSRRLGEKEKMKVVTAKILPTGGVTAREFFAPIAAEGRNPKVRNPKEGRKSEIRKTQPVAPSSHSDRLVPLRI